MIVVNRLNESNEEMTPMKLAPGQKQKLSQLASQRAHLRTNVELYKDQNKQQRKKPTD